MNKVKKLIQLVLTLILCFSVVTGVTVNNDDTKDTDYPISTYGNNRQESDN